ncbi:hypothetical protein SFR_2799 [Streptomyces sp. FR-008]|nr:hypothetical protein SFR_2799 [Streptomyces sp. FR-008]
MVVGGRQSAHTAGKSPDAPEPPGARRGAWYGRGRAVRRDRADRAGGAAGTGQAGQGGAVFGHDRVCWIMDRTHGGVSWECGRAAAYEAEA